MPFVVRLAMDLWPISTTLTAKSFSVKFVRKILVSFQKHIFLAFDILIFILKCDILTLFSVDIGSARNHIKEAKNLYDCNMCNAGFVYKAELIYHQTTQHVGEVPRRCKLCHTIFSSKFKFQEHRYEEKVCAQSVSE